MPRAEHRGEVLRQRVHGALCRNSVAPGSTDTGMLTRFVGTPENKAALVTTVPMGRLGLSEEHGLAIPTGGHVASTTRLC